MRRTVAVVLVLLAAPAAAGESRWVIEAMGQVALPAQPQRFIDGWRSGLGVGASLRARVVHVELGIEADFTQFGFDGLENIGSLGGERRMTRVVVPLRAAFWKGNPRRAERLEFEASAGWGHQSIAGTFGGLLATSPQTRDGFVGSLGLHYARAIYRQTLWSLGLRYTHFEFSDASPAHVAFLLGLQMPLDGSRPD